jgi:lysophospholipase L1-like esterase
MQVREAGIAWAVRSGRTTVLDRVEQQSLEAFRADLKCAVDAVNDIGAIPILATHANRFGSKPQLADEKWLVGWRMQYPELMEEGFIDLEARANSIIRTVAREKEVPLADAAELLNEDSNNFADHAHFTDEGASRMAGLLADTIISLRK